ncbi:hypothetical protein WDW37_07800 [Bdellovibrionota bacterium FG-1]
MSLAQSREWRNFVIRWMGLSLILHIITAWFSRGYHSADEYFQILEFLNYKLGGTPMKDLAVEFSERMRPWMQPFLYWCMTQTWLAVGVKSPFTWAFSFRLATGLIGWASSLAIALRATDWFESERARRLSVMAAALLWFLPSLHVRPSSESLAGSAFLLGMALCDWLATPHPKTLTTVGPLVLPDAMIRFPLWLLAGMLLGLSFEARFQMGFMIVGLGAWLFFRPGATAATFPRFRIGLALVVGFGLMVGLGRIVDHWGYGEWVFSPWRYLHYNLIRGEVNRFGNAPWWDVFRMSFTESWPFIGTALAAITLVAWVRHPRHILTWSQVPFFLVHELIPHKELRFFFPLALAGPALITLALVSRQTGRFFDPLESPAFRWLWRFLVANNILALAALCVLPYSRTAQFYEAVADLIPAQAQRFEIFYQERDPYLVLGNPVYFYRPPQLVTTAFQDYGQLAEKLQKHPQEPLWVFSHKFDLPPQASPIAAHCTPAYRTLGTWVKYINFFQWLERANAWTLFRCQL